MTWKDQLLELVQSGSYTTQGQLVSALSERGFTVHQGSVSRELRQLGVTKMRGRYVLADATFGAPIHTAHVTSNGCLVVLHTDPAFGPVLGQAIDDAALNGVLGTIAGDDTVFVATSGEEGAEALSALLDLPLESP